MATEFNRRAVAMAMCMSIPRAMNRGMRTKAAPTPAIVSRVVNARVINPARR